MTPPPSSLLALGAGRRTGAQHHCAQLTVTLSPITVASVRTRAWMIADTSGEPPYRNKDKSGPLRGPLGATLLAAGRLLNGDNAIGQLSVRPGGAPTVKDEAE